jgi:hypothetical protein
MADALTCSSTLENFSFTRCPFPVATLLQLPLMHGLERLPQLRTLCLDDLPAMADPSSGDHRMDHWRFLISATGADERDASPAPDLDLDQLDELSDPRFRLPSPSDVGAIEAAQDGVLGALVELCCSHDKDFVLDGERAPLSLSIAGWHSPSSSGSLVAALLQSLTDVQGVYEEFGMPLPVELHSSDPPTRTRSPCACVSQLRKVASPSFTSLFSPLRRCSCYSLCVFMCLVIAAVVGQQAECSESRPRLCCPSSLRLVIVRLSSVHFDS